MIGRIILFLGVGAAVLALVLAAARGNAVPVTLDVAQLPPAVAADVPFTGRIKVSPPNAVVRIVNRDDVIVSADGQIIWQSPAAGQQELHFQAGEGETAAEAVWSVSVIPASDEAPPTIAEIAITAPAPSPEPLVEEVEEIAQLPSEAPAPVVIQNLAPELLEAPDAIVDFPTESETPIAYASQEPLALPVETGIEPACLPTIDAFASPIVAQLDGAAKLYGNGRPIRKAFPTDYLEGKLTRVKFRCRFPSDPNMATALLDGLVAVGAELRDKPGPLSCEVDAVGSDLLAARGLAAIDLPPTLWQVLLRSAETANSANSDKVRPINQGVVEFRLANYALDEGAFAVVINPRDVISQ